MIGVEENDGRAIRPVKGIDISRTERIGKEMIGFNNLIMPYYQPRVFFETVDRQTIMVIWVSAGERRPYKVPEQVTSKEKRYNYYIRYNSSTIVAKDECFNELIYLANKVPFDDRGNPYARIEDVSMLLIRDYLAETGSSLVKEIEHLTPRQILEQMNLIEGPDELARVKNVALMMFSYHPERFFPGTQIDIVFYPRGKDADPNNFSEAEPFRGPIHISLRKALDYLKNTVIRRNVHKPKDDAHSIIIYNYPYQAIEEALVNAYYHRRYDEYQPVEVNVMPNQIEIISYGGAERSVRLDDLRAGKRIHARRYRNPRLGEFLKELHLTEGRGTGLPTIHDELRRNGSPDSIIEADDEHTYFMITIPCHPEFVCNELTIDNDGHLIPAQELNHKAKVPYIIQSGTPANNILNDDVPNNVPNKKDSKTRRIMMTAFMKKHPDITTSQLADILKVSRKTISRDINMLTSEGIIRREGETFRGRWIVDTAPTDND